MVKIYSNKKYGFYRFQQGDWNVCHAMATLWLQAKAEGRDLMNEIAKPEEVPNRIYGNILHCDKDDIAQSKQQEIRQLQSKLEQNLDSSLTFSILKQKTHAQSPALKSAISLRCWIEDERMCLISLMSDNSRSAESIGDQKVHTVKFSGGNHAVASRCDIKTFEFFDANFGHFWMKKKYMADFINDWWEDAEASKYHECIARFVWAM